MGGVRQSQAQVSRPEEVGSAVGVQACRDPIVVENDLPKAELEGRGLKVRETSVKVPPPELADAIGLVQNVQKLGASQVGASPPATVQLY
jgi:hypothetical protein